MYKKIRKHLTKKNLSALAAMTSLFVWGGAVSSTAEAYQTENVYYDGKTFAEMAFFPKGEWVSGYTLSSPLIDATKSATSYWVGMLAPYAMNNSPWQLAVVTKNYFQNAEAFTASYKEGKTDSDVPDNYVSALIQNGKNLEQINWDKFTDLDDDEDDEKIIQRLPSGDSAFSLIRIGQNFGAARDGATDGWYIDTDTVLPTNEQAADFVGTFRHELGHALGISSRKMTSIDYNGNKTDETTENPDGTLFTKFEDGITYSNSWTLHLIDQNGTPAKPGMFIVTNNTLDYLKQQNPNLDTSNYFVVDKGNYAYFVGDNVSEVLDGATFHGVNGLPVNGWEKEKFDGAHLQTTGMMSHRPYSNYTSFMEVELAVMQDLGYKLDRKAYFGRSIYGNGGTINNTQGYFARNAEGTDYRLNTFSQVPLGVGLHVYGSNNNVTQSADILTEGTGAVGIRVDGEGNTINIPETTIVSADGYRGKGVLIAYGRDQILNQAGTVTARNQGGNAVEFNFGSSSNGAKDEYRGSYIRYEREVNSYDGKIISGQDLSLNNPNIDSYNASPDELNGALVSEYNLSGTIIGGENAIYIGKNAFVKDINVNQGAAISGNITSDWKHFSEKDGIYELDKKIDYTAIDEDGNISEETGEIGGMSIQYDGKLYTYSSYIPDLVTNLNFNGDLNYSGNITGYDNMKVKFNSGANVIHTGTANVVNVTVEKDAQLFGNTYTVNDMSEKMAEGLSDDTTGKFFNHGTIAPYSPDNSMTINGDLVSDGTLTAQGGGSAGNIVVSGSANVEGSTISATNALPDENLNVLNAGSVSGNITNGNGNFVPITGMLNASGNIEGNSISVQTQFSNNMGELNSTQNEVLGFVRESTENYRGAGDMNEKVLRGLYSLDSDSAKNSLSQIGTTDSAQMMALAQQSTTVNRVIGDRISNVFSTQTVEVNVGGNNFADGDNNSVVMGVNVDVPTQPDNNAWIKFTKNWGEVKGGANYHGQAISGGYDHAIGEHWRTGFFVSYNSTGWGANSGSGNIYDTRFGIYGGYHKGQHEGYIYLDGGKIRNKLRRGISALGLISDASYNGTIFEIGGEYKYDLQPEKTWHVSPFVNLQFSSLKQNSYRETGLYVFNQNVMSKRNTYFAGQIGVEFKRKFKIGSYGARVGIRHAFTGANPELNFNYEGSDRIYTLKNDQDKTHFVLSLNGETEFAKGWIFGGEAIWQKGSHDKDLSASLMFRREW